MPKRESEFASVGTIADVAEHVAAAHIPTDIVRGMDVARTLREARIRAGLTQRELAKRSGTSQATVSAYERGRKEPSVRTLARLLAAAGARLSVTPGANAVVRPSPAERARAGRQLVDVLLLAEALPTRHEPVLRFPRLPVSGARA